MYYNQLKRRLDTVSDAIKAMNQPRASVEDCIAPYYLPLHEDVQEGKHTTYNLPGGRGSCKSSFVSLEIVNGIMEDPDANAIVFRRTAATMRESVYAQIAWAIDTLGVSQLWKGNVSPLQYTYLPTGQTIVFRGLDVAEKLKSIKPRRGVFRYVWFEEFSELTGANMVRSVLQSVVRGGDSFKVFNSFNPPISLNNWANKYVLEPDPKSLTFQSTYLDVPKTWLGEAFILEAEHLKEINPKAYEHEYLGKAVGSGGEVFPNIEAHTITDDEIEQMQYIYCGLDFGFSVDPFAFIRCSYDRKKQTIYLLDEIYLRNKSNSDIAELIKARGYDVTGDEYRSLFDGQITHEPQLITCDCAEPKSIADLRGLGLKVAPCKKYAGCVAYRIKWLQSKILAIDPQRTPNAFNEFSTYEYVTTKDGEFTTDVPDANNHTIDALAYALDRLINSKHNSA
jgi:PBSX family phage terminase large subunit